MEYRKLGNSGLKVSAIGLGGINFGWSADEGATIAIVNKALELGINFIDTSDNYNKGRSEEFVGEAVKGKRSQVIVATKFGLPVGEGPNATGASRYHITKELESSLRRLQTDYIDLYQLHRPDPATPIEETLRALDDAVRAGKVRYIGCSQFAGWQLCQALWTSRANNLNSFVTVQPQYNLFSREIETELVPCCLAYSIGVIPFTPLARGYLTGKYRNGQEIPASARSKLGQRSRPDMTDVEWAKLAKFEAFATDNGHAVGELALAWLLAKPYVSTVIVGVHNPEQVIANAGAASWKLTAEQVASIDAIR